MTTKPYIRILAARRTDTSIQMILQMPNGGTQFKSWPRDLDDLVVEWVNLNVENPHIQWHPTI